MVNSFVINLSIILAYIKVYRSLKFYYSSVQKEFKKFLDKDEKRDMDETLSSLLTFFSCICQCFAYRITQRIIMEVFKEEFFAPKSTLSAVVKNLYFLSEMIMIIGICISIKRSVTTAKQQS
jgi:hypothetical protein